MGIWGPRGQDGDAGCCLILMRFALELKKTDGPAAWKPSAISLGTGKQGASSYLWSLPSYSQPYLPVSSCLGSICVASSHIEFSSHGSFCYFLILYVSLLTVSIILFPAVVLPISAPSWWCLNLLQVVKGSCMDYQEGKVDTVLTSYFSACSQFRALCWR